MTWEVRQGDVREQLRELDAESIQTCVTSPPYWGLRDYGDEGQLGLEPTPEQYVANMVEVFREVRRVLRPDGTLWLNLGDSYAGTAKGSYEGQDKSGLTSFKTQLHGSIQFSKIAGESVKPKDLVGIPWMIAFALRADGWWLRSDIIWAKPNPMPESVTDRPTRSHEYLFLLTKSARYFYDADAIREGWADERNGWAGDYERGGEGTRRRTDGTMREDWFDGPPRTAGRNRRSVWTVTTQPYAEAHFATFPPKLIEPCILAGATQGDTVLDPFAGSGTTGVVALRHDRSFVGIELNPEYVEMARNRIRDDAPLLNTDLEVAA